MSSKFHNFNLFLMCFVVPCPFRREHLFQKTYSAISELKAGSQIHQPSLRQFCDQADPPAVALCHDHVQIANALDVIFDAVVRGDGRTWSFHVGGIGNGHADGLTIAFEQGAGHFSVLHRPHAASHRMVAGHVGHLRRISPPSGENFVCVLDRIHSRHGNPASNEVVVEFGHFDHGCFNGLAGKTEKNSSDDRNHQKAGRDGSHGPHPFHGQGHSPLGRSWNLRLDQLVQSRSIHGHAPQFGKAICGCLIEPLVF